MSRKSSTKQAKCFSISVLLNKVLRIVNWKIILQHYEVNITDIATDSAALKRKEFKTTIFRHWIKLTHMSRKSSTKQAECFSISVLLNKVLRIVNWKIILQHYEASITDIATDSAALKRKESKTTIFRHWIKLTYMSRKSSTKQAESFSISVLLNKVLRIVNWKIILQHYEANITDIATDSAALKRKEFKTTIFRHWIKLTHMSRKSSTKQAECFSISVLLNKVLRIVNWKIILQHYEASITDIATGSAALKRKESKTTIFRHWIKLTYMSRKSSTKQAESFSISVLLNKVLRIVNWKIILQHYEANITDIATDSAALKRQEFKTTIFRHWIKLTHMSRKSSTKQAECFSISVLLNRVLRIVNWKIILQHYEANITDIATDSAALKRKESKTTIFRHWIKLTHMSRKSSTKQAECFSISVLLNKVLRIVNWKIILQHYEANITDIATDSAALKRKESKTTIFGTELSWHIWAAKVQQNRLSVF